MSRFVTDFGGPTRGVHVRRPLARRLLFRRQFYLQLPRIVAHRLRHRDRRALFVSLMGGIGDLVNFFPTLERLAAECEVEMATAGYPYRLLVGNNPFVGRVWTPFMTDVHDDVIRAGIARLGPDGLPLAVPATREEAALLLPPLPLPRPLGFLAPAERLATRLVIYRDFRKSRLGQRLLGPLKLTPERLASLGLIGNVQYDILAITRDGQFPGMREAWALTERHVRGIRDLAAAHDIPFVLTVYPHAHQVSATESPAGRGHVGIGPGLYSSEAPFQILERLGRREGFPVISLLRAFRAAEASEAPLFRTDDIHHTPAGTRVFAEAFVQRLLAEPALGRLLGGCGGPERQERTKGQAKRRRKLVESRSRRACLSPSGPRPSRR